MSERELERLLRDGIFIVEDLLSDHPLARSAADAWMQQTHAALQAGASTPPEHDRTEATN